MKIIVKYQIFENLDFNEKEPKTSGFIDFSTSNIQISHADACVRCCAGLPIAYSYGAKHSLKKLSLKYTSGGDFDVLEPGIKNVLSIKVYFYSKHLPDMVTNVFLQHNKM